MITEIDHFQLTGPVGCEPAAREFYGELLGLPEIPKPPLLEVSGGVWFELGNGQQLHIGIEPDFTPARKAHPGLTTTDLDALAAVLGNAGVEVIWDERIPGVRRFKAHDPFGNQIEFRTG
jgi:catechol 2,3-dioxygenase-like lactoylglutathione lyase family enzyme